MDAFTELTSLSCALPMANIDTDQLIPARFMKEPRSVGYGQFLLHDLRFDDNGQAQPEFPLNQNGADAARIMVAGRNFGAGSSREAAVYALYDYGFRCVIAPSFGDIFAANAVNNGVLPALVSEADNDAIFAALAAGDGVLHVDLHHCQIHCGERTWSFSLSPVWRTKLLNGWDDIDLTEARRDDIDRFVERYRQARAWTQPNPGISATKNVESHPG